MNIEEALKVAREEGKEVGLRKALKLVDKVARTRLKSERRLAGAGTFLMRK